MKNAQIKILDFSTGKPVVVRIIDYVYNELAKTGQYDLMIQGSQDLLAESKRLNDQFNGRA